MSLAARARGAAQTATTRLADRWWSIPLAIYRLSGGRLGDSRQLYRARIGEQERQFATLPGMTTPSERAYFKWQTEQAFTGQGAIVDLGSWFGSTTVTLAMGVVANPRPEARGATIHAYDRFEWESWMDDYKELAPGGPYRVGDSFLDGFKKVIAPWRDHVEVHAGDLCEEGWGGSAIEVLLVDAMKAWDVTHRILTQFYAALMDDAYLIHQDFSNCFTPWIHLVSYRLREHFAPVVDVPRSETLVFRLVRRFEDISELSLTAADFDRDEIEEAFEYSLRLASAEKHSGIRAAHLIQLVYDDDLPRARRLLEAHEAAGQLDEFHAGAVRGAIGRATNAGSRTR